MNRATAEKTIRSIFQKYGAAGSTSLSKMTGNNHGKIYELYVLSLILKELYSRGYKITYSQPGSALAFKANPGLVKQSDPHFVLQDQTATSDRYQVFVNVEFTTLGTSLSIGGSGDKSGHHELDIGVFDHGVTGRPRHDRVALGIECKAVTKFTKALVRGALGLRRELSFRCHNQPTRLKGGGFVPAEPASELRLFSTDSRIRLYMDSPKMFGIECRWEKP